MYYQTLEEEYPDLVCESRAVEGDKWAKDFVVLRLTAAQKSEREGTSVTGCRATSTGFVCAAVSHKSWSYAL